MDEIFKIIFGEYTWIELFGYAWFLIIGYVIYGLTETTGRDVQSTHTPKKWSWKFWLGDNWKRYLTTVLFTYIFFRFYIEFVGHPLTNFEALMMGLIGDGVGATAKKRVNALKADREKLMSHMPNEELG
jgi:hypothetical protein